MGTYLFCKLSIMKQNDTLWSVGREGGRERLTNLQRSLPVNFG